MLLRASEQGRICCNIGTKLAEQTEGSKATRTFNRWSSTTDYEHEIIRVDIAVLVGDGKIPDLGVQF